MKAVRIFKDLVSFLTIIPLAKDESFLEASARYMFLFPLVGGIIGLLAAAYFHLSFYLFSFVFSFVDIFFTELEGLLVKIFSAGCTLSFLLVLTGLQHFDGLVDFGNVLGLKNLEERELIAHAWVVTYKGAFLAVFVELLTFLGIFLSNLNIVFKALICSEVSAKLAMVTVAWVGKPTPKGLGALFAKINSRRKLNFAAYLISVCIIFPLLGWLSLILILLSFSLGFFMGLVSERTFGGVSGDVLGATNEITRAICILLITVMVVP
ncbi:MAG: adenosylcobinamide-GDP ribazoletransferase [Candidatus Bathyarchaeia archaeon]